MMGPAARANEAETDTAKTIKRGVESLKVAREAEDLDEEDGPAAVGVAEGATGAAETGVGVAEGGVVGGAEGGDEGGTTGGAVGAAVGTIGGVGSQNEASLTQATIRVLGEQAGIATVLEPEKKADPQVG